MDNGGSTDPTNDNGDYRIIRMNDRANTELLRMDLKQSLSALDPVTQRDMRVMHLIEEPLSCGGIGP